MKAPMHALVTITSDQALHPFEAVYPVISFLVGRSVSTLGLLRHSDPAAYALRGRFPWLPGPADVTPETVHDILAQIVAEHGAEVELPADMAGVAKPYV